MYKNVTSLFLTLVVALSQRFMETNTELTVTYKFNRKTTNSVALVRERTLSDKRSSLVDVVSVKFCG
jgi:hypothetical protein